jgi:hypothetical protein
MRYESNPPNRRSLTAPVKPIALNARRLRLLYHSLVAVSLAETLIVVGLVGLLLLPVLLTSTTYFSGQIMKTRQRLSLAHNVNLVLNQLTNHLGATNQLISSSTAETFTPADEIHYSFYDPVKMTQVYGGYRLTTVSGRRKLEALQYSAGTWSAISPYRTSVATAYTLPSGTVFDYCNDDGCSKTPDQATFVRLTGWTFRDESAPARTYALPTTNIYLGSRRATEGKLTGQKAKLLYSTTPTQAFGSAANLELLALSPGRKTLWAAPTLSGGGLAAGLHTIASGLNRPGEHAMLVDEARGNVFFFDENGDLYHWNNTMLTAAFRTSTTWEGGERASIISPYTGRLYFGCTYTDSCPISYYDPATNTVSTITGAMRNFGSDALLADPGRKVIYAGWDDYSNNSGLIMFNEDTGTTTTISSSTSANSDVSETLSLNPVTGRLYFAYRRATGSVQAWTPTLSSGNYTTGTLLTTIGNGTLVTVGTANSIQALPKANNEVLIGDNATVFKWKDGDTGVTTIYNSAGSTPMQALYYWPAAMRSIHNFNFRYDASRDIAYWYQHGTGTSTVKRGVYAYNFGTSTLTTVSNAGVSSGRHSLWLDSNTGNLYWGSGASGDLGIYRWNPATNTRTLLFTAGAAGAGGNNGLFVSADSGHLFVKPGGTTGVNIYNLNTSSLSTLWTGTYNNNSAIMDPVSSRIFFSADDSSAAYTQFSWDATNGLNTILNTEGFGAFCGEQGDHAIDSVRKFFVFGCDHNPFNVYVYNYDPAAGGGGGSSTTLYKASQQGQPAGKLTMDLNPSGSYTYKAAALDGSRNLFYVNTATNAIDRYAYNNGQSKYELSATLSSTSTVINAPSALVIDPATAGFSVLNGSTKKVYVFANRTAATSTITPASNFDVTEATTPTGMAIDRRNGDYYIVDSAVTSDTIKVRRYTSGGVYKGTAYDLTIDVSASALGTSAATGEANFKITLDELSNVLYLAAPTLNRLYVLAIPEPAA